MGFSRQPTPNDLKKLFAKAETDLADTKTGDKSPAALNLFLQKRISPINGIIAAKEIVDASELEKHLRTVDSANKSNHILHYIVDRFINGSEAMGIDRDPTSGAVTHASTKYAFTLRQGITGYPYLTDAAATEAFLGKGTPEENTLEFKKIIGDALAGAFEKISIANGGFKTPAEAAKAFGEMCENFDGMYQKVIDNLDSLPAGDPLKLDKTAAGGGNAQILQAATIITMSIVASSPANTLPDTATLNESVKTYLKRFELMKQIAVTSRIATYGLGKTNIDNSSYDHTVHAARDLETLNKALALIALKGADFDVASDDASVNSQFDSLQFAEKKQAAISLALRLTINGATESDVAATVSTILGYGADLTTISEQQSKEVALVLATALRSQDPAPVDIDRTIRDYLSQTTMADYADPADAKVQAIIYESDIAVNFTKACLQNPTGLHGILNDKRVAERVILAERAAGHDPKDPLVFNDFSGKRKIIPVLPKYVVMVKSTDGTLVPVTISYNTKDAWRDGELPGAEIVWHQNNFAGGAAPATLDPAIDSALRKIYSPTSLTAQSCNDNILGLNKNEANLIALANFKALSEGVKGASLGNIATQPNLNDLKTNIEALAQQELAAIQNRLDKATQQAQNRNQNNNQSQNNDIASKSLRDMATLENSYANQTAAEKARTPMSIAEGAMGMTALILAFASGFFIYALIAVALYAAVKGVGKGARQLNNDKHHHSVIKAEQHRVKSLTDPHYQQELAEKQVEKTVHAEEKHKEHERNSNKADSKLDDFRKAHGLANSTSTTDSTGAALPQKPGKKHFIDNARLKFKEHEAGKEEDKEQKWGERAKLLRDRLDNNPGRP